MAEGLLVLSDETFDATLGTAQRPVLVDFWAEWCAPCHVQHAILEELQASHSETILFATVEVSENRLTAERHQILSVPTLVLFDGDTVVSRVSGLKRAPQIVRMIRDHLGV